MTELTAAAGGREGYPPTAVGLARAVGGPWLNCWFPPTFWKVLKLPICIEKR